MPPTKNAYRAARNLRRTLSPPEILLWARLKGSKPRIRRQHPIGRFVADFYCAAARLIIEVDGQHHDFGDRSGRDADRQRWLELRGLTFNRVAARDVLRDPDEIADSILRLCQTPPPSPLLR